MQSEVNGKYEIIYIFDAILELCALMTRSDIIERSQHKKCVLRPAAVILAQPTHGRTAVSSPCRSKPVGPLSTLLRRKREALSAGRGGTEPPRFASETGLLGQDQGIVDLDAEAAHGALQLGMAEQELAGPQVARPLVDEGDLGPAQAMGAVAGRVEAGQGDPVVDETAVLPRRDVVSRVAPAREQPVARPRAPLHQPSRERAAGRLGHLERHGSAGLLLDDGRSEAHALTEVNVGHPELDEVAATKLAVDRDVERGEVADMAVVLKSGPDGPDVLGPEGRLRADDPAAVPGHADRRLRYRRLGHGELP